MAGPSAAKATDRFSAGAWPRHVAYRRMEGAFEEAAQRLGTVERWYRVAGLSIRATFAGSSLIAAIDPALSHLATSAAPAADLKVCLWDSASSGIPVPALPDGGDETVRGPLETSSLVRSSYHPVPAILTLYDPGRRSGMFWVPDARSVPSNEVASPLRTLLHWWARDQGLQFVHAGAVAFGGRAVLICGPSGAGKSTTTLACLLGGLDYLGDDYVLLDGRSGLAVHSLYSAAKLQPGQVAAFPELRAALTNRDRLETEKALWFMHRDFPERTRAFAEAVAVLVPRVTGRRGSSLVPIRRSTALAALAPSTIAQLAQTDGWALSAIAGFVSGLPAYRLEAGTDLRGLAGTVRELIERAGRAS